MPMIRTVFQPDTPRDVDEAEAAQLGREGLLLPLEDEQPAPAAAAPAVPKAAAPASPTPTTTPAKEASPDGDKQAQ